MSKQRNIRKARLSFADEDGDDQVEMKAVKDATPKLAVNNTKAKEKKSSLLSFDDDIGADEDDLLPQSKKAGKKKPSLRAPTLAPLPEAEIPSTYTQVAQAGEYSMDRLRELHLTTQRAPGSKALPPPTFKLAGSFKQTAPANDKRFNHNLESTGLVVSQQQPPLPSTTTGSAAQLPAAATGMSLPPPSSKPPPTTDNGMKAITEEQDYDEDGNEMIPDEETIRRAREKRERIRTARMAPDYISLEGGSNTEPFGNNQHRQTKGRNNDDEDILMPSPSGSHDTSGDEEEEPARLKFVGNDHLQQKQKQKSKHKNINNIEQVVDGDDDDEEEASWAEEQIRKGLSSNLHAAAALAAASKSKNNNKAIKQKKGSAAALDDLSLAKSKPTTGLSSAATAANSQASITSAADIAMATLQAALQRAQLSHRQAEKNLTSTQRSLEDARNGIEITHQELKSVSDRYVQVQRMKAYIADLCNMLQAKSPLVEELEEELIKLREGRAVALIERTSFEDIEEHTTATAAITAALRALSAGESEEQASIAAQTAATVAEERILSGEDLPEELDEFGRDVNYEKRAAIAERAHRRLATFNAAAQKLLAHANGTTTTDNGATPMDTDNNTTTINTNNDNDNNNGGIATTAEPILADATSEESEGELNHYNLRYNEIQEAATVVFKDASEEFSTLTAIKSRLELYKAQCPGQYRDAYLALSAPALFAPFVRLDLLKWAPLDGSIPGFGDQPWYSLLFDYGIPTDPSLADPEDPDADLVPRLVATLVLPLAKSLLSKVWRPTSRRQSKAASALVGDLIAHLPPEDPGIQEVLHDVRTKLEAVVEGTELPAWPPAALAVSLRARAHLIRRFDRGVRLLTSLAAFEGVFPQAFILDLAVHRLIGARLLPYIRAAVASPANLADRAYRVVKAMAPQWLSTGCPRGLEPLLDLVRTVSRSLEAESSKEGARERLSSGEVEKLAVVLGELGDEQSGHRLKLMYGIQ